MHMVEPKGCTRDAAARSVVIPALERLRQDGVSFSLTNSTQFQHQTTEKQSPLEAKHQPIVPFRPHEYIVTDVTKIWQEQQRKDYLAQPNRLVYVHHDHDSQEVE